MGAPRLTVSSIGPPSAAPLVNNGAEFVAGIGLCLVASQSDSVATNFNPATAFQPKFSLSSGQITIHLTGGTGNSQYAIGNSQAGGGSTALQRSGGGTSYSGRINTGDVTTGATVNGGTGLITTNRPSATKQR